MSKKAACLAGTEIKQVGNVSVCCIKPDYRDCLDRAMEEWKQHKKNLPKTLMGKRYRPGVYAFAYWLIRWSGLVQPTQLNFTQGQDRV